MWPHAHLHVLCTVVAGALQLKLGRLERVGGACVQGRVKGSGRLPEERRYVMPWKVGFALAGGGRAGKAQACLAHNERVAGASVMGGGRVGGE